MVLLYQSAGGWEGAKQLQRHPMQHSALKLKQKSKNIAALLSFLDISKKKQPSLPTNQTRAPIQV